ncbi:hypothetical protein ACVW0P_003351 [Mucilaginibacter sp. UYNi724]
MKKYYNVILFTLAVTGLTSCLKDDKTNLTPNNSPAVVEFSSSLVELPASPVGSTYALFERAYDAAAETDVPFDINYTGGEAAPKDLKITFGVKPEAVAQYVAERLERDRKTVVLGVMPANLYTLPTGVVIPKGQRKVTVHIKVKTNQVVDFTKITIPISITDADGATISGNYGTILAKVNVKNQYDANYHSSGRFTHPVAASSRDLDADKRLLTVDANTVSTSIADVGSSMNLTVNADNSVTVVGSLSATQPLSTVPGKTNTYDPATKTFHLNIRYSGGGGFRIIQEDLKRID